MDRPIIDASVTCSSCASYISYQDSRGWCNIFNRQAKDNYSMTRDCQQNGAITLVAVTEAELEESEYQVGDRIKVIEAEAHHASWKEYTVLDVFKNEDLHRSQASYLEESRWYYRVQTEHQRRLWLAEDRVCHAHQSNLISTDEEIF